MLRDNNIEQLPTGGDVLQATLTTTPPIDDEGGESRQSSTDLNRILSAESDFTEPTPTSSQSPPRNTSPAGTTEAPALYPLTSSKPTAPDEGNLQEPDSIASVRSGSRQPSLGGAPSPGLWPSSPIPAAPGSVSTDRQSQSEISDEGSDVTSQLAARMGSLRIAEDGQLRYYGSTSNLHLHPNGYPSLSRPSIRHVSTEGDDVLRRMGLDRAVPLVLQIHLAKLYFAWEDPAIHAVDEKAYFQEKRKWDADREMTPYYSETLNNAV